MRLVWAVLVCLLSSGNLWVAASPTCPTIAATCSGNNTTCNCLPGDTAMQQVYMLNSTDQSTHTLACSQGPTCRLKFIATFASPRQTLNWACSSARSCTNASLSCSFASTPTTNCRFSCTGEESCTNSILSCPTGYCTLDCGPNTASSCTGVRLLYSGGGITAPDGLSTSCDNIVCYCTPYGCYLGPFPSPSPAPALAPATSRDQIPTTPLGTTTTLLSATQTTTAASTSNPLASSALAASTTIALSTNPSSNTLATTSPASLSSSTTSGQSAQSASPSSSLVPSFSSSSASSAGRPSPAQTTTHLSPSSTLTPTPTPTPTPTLTSSTPSSLPTPASTPTPTPTQPSSIPSSPSRGSSAPIIWNSPVVNTQYVSSVPILANSLTVVLPASFTGPFVAAPSFTFSGTLVVDLSGYAGDLTQPILLFGGEFNGSFEEVTVIVSSLPAECVAGELGPNGVLLVDLLDTCQTGAATKQAGLACLVLEGLSLFSRT